jgi:hypothetical protein
MTDSKKPNAKNMSAWTEDELKSIFLRFERMG